MREYIKAEFVYKMNAMLPGDIVVKAIISGCS